MNCDFQFHFSISLINYLKHKLGQFFFTPSGLYFLIRFFTLLHRAHNILRLPQKNMAKNFLAALTLVTC